MDSFDLFEDHYDLYDKINKRSDGSNKFISLISKICSHLEPYQIFDLYNTSRENIQQNKDNIKEYEIFSSILLNVSKLVLNNKLIAYENKLANSINEEDFKKYIIDTKFSPRAKKLEDKITIARSSKEENIEQVKYLEGLYISELERRFLPELSRVSSNTKYAKAVEDIRNLNASGLKNDIIDHYCEELFSAMFHADIKAVDNNLDQNQNLAKHYRSVETAKNTAKLMKLKNNYLDYLKNHKDTNKNFNKINHIAETTGEILTYQETQEMQEKDDWNLTKMVLGSINPNAKDINEYFSNPEVQKFLTPKRFEAGKLYVHAFKGNEEIKLMTRYLAENITKGRIHAKKDDKHEEIITPVKAIMPKKCTNRVVKAIEKKLRLKNNTPVPQ